MYERRVRIDLHLIDPEVPDRVLEEVNRTEEMIVKILIKVCHNLSIVNLHSDKRVCNLGGRRQLLVRKSGIIKSK